MKERQKKDGVQVIANVRVGKPDVDPGKPSHVRGVREGNARGNMRKTKGLKAKGQGAVAKATRSTGINSKAHEPIDPRMPVLTPA